MQDHVNLWDETPLMDLATATQEFPIQCSHQSVERWARIGVRGVRLETVMVGNRKFTTASAIRRFLDAQQPESK